MSNGGFFQRHQKVITGLIILLALVALGLSIGAFATKCNFKDGFGDSNQGTCPNKAKGWPWPEPMPLRSMDYCQCSDTMHGCGSQSGELQQKWKNDYASATCKNSGQEIWPFRTYE